MEQRSGMVEKRGMGLWLTHGFMITGVLIIFFPIWLAFVASTVTQPEIVSPPMPLLPGGHFWENYKTALLSGVNVPVATMLMNSLIMAIGIAVGKIIISLLSAFAIVYFRSSTLRYSGFVLAQRTRIMFARAQLKLLLAFRDERKCVQTANRRIGGLLRLQNQSKNCRLRQAWCESVTREWHQMSV